MQKKEQPSLVALITGASSGVGCELAKILASDSYNLILCGRNKQALEELKATLRVQVEIVAGDLGVPDDQEALIRIIHEKKPDLVINSAGLGFYGELTDKEVKETIEVNCQALTLVTLAACKMFKATQKSGTVMNISSVFGFLPTPSMSVYAASKAYVLFFSEALDFEMQKQGVRILTSCPGGIKTAFKARASRKQQEDITEPSFMMSAETAARKIYAQIKKGRSVQIIDWKSCLFVFLMRLIPRRRALAFLHKEIQNRLLTHS